MDSTPPPIPAGPQLGPQFAPALVQSSAPLVPYALYLPGAATLATFLGSSVAGTTILALNYRRLGKSGSAIMAMAIGIIASIFQIVLAFVLPSRTPGTIIALLPVFIMARLAPSMQGQAVEQHKQAGGKIASMWKAAGIGAIWFVVVIVIIFAAVIANEPQGGTHLKVGNSEVIYFGSATEADAQALGKALTAIGYFGTTKATSVLLDKQAGVTTVKFVVNEEAGQKPQTLATYAKFVDIMAPSIGGKPITLKLVTPELKELQSKVIDQPAPALPAALPPAATQPAPNPQAILPPVPVAPAAVPASPPANPAIASNDADKFTGTFASEKLTVVLKPAGPGQFTGSIKLADKELPATARLADGQLVGTFESEGSTFDFTATVNGQAMHLVSGNNEFNLTKRPKNPLAQ